MHPNSHLPYYPQQQPPQQQWHSVNTSIDIDSLSPKQLVGQCIDLATTMLKQLVTHFCQFNKLSGPNSQKPDFSAISNYILEPSRLDSILDQYVKGGDKGTKALAKSWLFQLKYMRNSWAHSQNITYRMAIRAFDTLGMLYQVFGGDANSELFNKIQRYRKKLAVSQAKKYVQEGFN